jgi:Ion channel
MSTMFPAFRRADTARYLAILVLILATIGFQLAAPDTEWARLVIVVLQSGTLFLALQVGRVHGALDRVLLALIAASLVLSAIALASFASLGDTGARVINLLLLAYAPIAIFVGMIADMRARHRVTVRTIIGVLSIYLLIGLIFTFIFGIIASESSGTFFKHGVEGTSSDYLYFSYATLTTVGYGDLVANLHVGRSIAIIEALIGQIYLVSVVSLIVGNLGRLPSGAALGGVRSPRGGRAPGSR